MPMPPKQFHFVPRHAVAISDEYSTPPHLLDNWRHIGAYVLLAEPGAGKTEAFKAERQQAGGLYVSARDFITLRPENFSGKGPIYIDGLDEIRAGSRSHRAPLDDIRRRLDELGRPAFRLSCREADWRSAVDRDTLRTVAPGSELVVLHLQELSDTDIVEVLQDLLVERPDDFLRESVRHGIRSLLGNPLLLHLIVDAVGKDTDRWPSNRSTIYRMACERLATEYNQEHRAERSELQSVDGILQTGGLLSAIWLLAGTAGFSEQAISESSGVVPADVLPQFLGLSDVHAVLSSKLFVADGETRVPRHRTIAEFLAAQVIGSKIAAGLAIDRVLSLMSGSDGGIVDPLRGLHAWLSTHCKEERHTLINADPLGVVLYGDLSVFSKDEKKQVLVALHREAQRFAWFRKGNWESQPFGALGTTDMTEVFQSLLLSTDRSIAHQSLLECALEAIEYGESMPTLVPNLSAIVRDASFTPAIRLGALDAWLAKTNHNPEASCGLLNEINTGQVSDPDDQLAGRLLATLYPNAIGPSEVLGYYREPKSESFYGLYQDFWRRRLIPATPAGALPDLMDSWAKLPPLSSRSSAFTHAHIAGELLSTALVAKGDGVSTETLYNWLGVVLDEHNFLRLTEDDVKSARSWLAARPATLKALMAYGWARVRSDSSTGRRFFWESESRTLGAKLPSDWYSWLLEHAAQVRDEDLARYCFESAAHMALNPRPEFVISMEDVERWVQRNSEHWPRAQEWLENAWSVPLEHWQREHSQREREYKTKQEILRTERRVHTTPHLRSIFDGTAPAGLMHQVALAHEGRYIDIHGETAAERVQAFLGGTTEEALSAIQGIEFTLARDDLPDVEEILKTDRANRHHYIRAACLLAASLAYKRTPQVYLTWSDDLARKLSAFWLTDGVGDVPAWFISLGAQRPAVVAPVLEVFALQRFRKRGETHIPGLWQLSREERLAELARLVVPNLVRAFPLRANESQLRILNGELLPAALRYMTQAQFSELVDERIARKSLDPVQRIGYLVAGLAIDGEKYSRRLLKAIGSSEARAGHLGRAIEWQGDRQKSASVLPVAVLGRLIELVAPHAVPDRPTGTFWVGDADRRRDWTYHFVSQLAASPSTEAGAEIARLRALPALQRWKHVLEGTAFDQARARRDATFQQPSVEDVANVLANRAPTNPRDLLALTMQHLRMLEGRLRGDDTNGLRLFRRDDGRTPKTENECRDILLDKLRAKFLTLGISLQKEAAATQDTRVDLRAEFVRPSERFVLPIEIKKADHRELWSAWRTQVYAYVVDPAAAGIGIYLVLWFGTGVRASPEGSAPSTPEGLEAALASLVPQDGSYRLRVVVLDLSFSVRELRERRLLLAP